MFSCLEMTGVSLSSCSDLCLTPLCLSSILSSGVRSSCLLCASSLHNLLSLKLRSLGIMSVTAFLFSRGVSTRSQRGEVARGVPALPWGFVWNPLTAAGSWRRRREKTPLLYLSSSRGAWGGGVAPAASMGGGGERRRCSLFRATARRRSAGDTFNFVDGGCRRSCTWGVSFQHHYICSFWRRRTDSFSFTACICCTLWRLHGLGGVWEVEAPALQVEEMLEVWMHVEGEILVGKSCHDCFYDVFY